MYLFTKYESFDTSSYNFSKRIRIDDYHPKTSGPIPYLVFKYNEINLKRQKTIKLYTRTGKIHFQK